MPVSFDAQSMVVQLIWESSNFASGAGSTTLGFNTNLNGAVAIDGFMTAIRNAWNTNLRPITDGDYTLASLAWETQTLSGEQGVNLAGGASITGPPSNCATIVSYKAAEKGPRNRGRNFWPGLLGETQVDEGGVIIPTTLATTIAAMSAFFTACLAHPNVLSQSIVQSTTPGQASPPNHPWPQVVSRTAQAKIGTQRRRVRP